MGLKNFCLDCNKEIFLTSKRCKSCAKKGKNNSSWRGGLPFCIDCGKKLSARHCKRCSKCSKLVNAKNLIGKKLKNHSGKKHWNWKGGIKRLPDCVDCGKKVSSINYKRCIDCLIKFRLGKNNPNYIDGRSYERYPREFNTKLKFFIRDRDNHTCQGCGISEQEYFKITKRFLSIHHIDYNKFNCVKSNLITTCLWCNSLANTDRDYWYAYYSFLNKNADYKLIIVNT